jgi:hypothetical protein
VLEGEKMGDMRVYRTESGTIFRVSQDTDGHLSVQLLNNATLWESAPIGMAGLRIAPTTTQLTDRQVKALPR